MAKEYLSEKEPAEQILYFVKKLKNNASDNRKKAEDIYNDLHALFKEAVEEKNYILVNELAGLMLKCVDTLDDTDMKLAKAAEILAKYSPKPEAGKGEPSFSDLMRRNG